jgi:NTE family protein
MCLAADLLTGYLVELHSGYLPDAIRASSAVPTIFTPIRIDSALLIDGGILRNYAAKEVRDMGADIVIGSYTGHQAYSEDQLQSVPGIIKQIAFLRSFEDFQEQKKLTDILIEPDLKGYSSTVFSNVDSIVEKGYRAALPYKNYFKRLADSLYNIEPLQPIEKILERHTLCIDKIEITGNKIYSDYQILEFCIRPGGNR